MLKHCHEKTLNYTGLNPDKSRWFWIGLGFSITSLDLNTVMGLFRYETYVLAIS